ncbi:MAG: zinc/iron-chelating domain-containing protein [Planctomycetaceae bacterium]|nr:zinc/iron-chelating domain-containing protein [Planctomycetaceae bacterium]
MRKQKIKRKDLKPGEVLCEYCTAKCCRYFALPIETPKDIEDFQHLRWYMMHGRVSLFVEDDVWYLMVHADCKHILPDNRCGAYETRPTICRTYTTENCEYDDDACYEKFFESPEQIWEYAEAIMPQKKKKKSRKKNKEVALPVLA